MKKESLNLRMFEIETDVDKLPIDSLNDLLNNATIEKYAYIKHDKDTNDDGSFKHNHYHIFIKLKNPRNVFEITNKYVPNNFVRKIKSNWNYALQYLIHYNAPDKFQYNEDDVIANFNYKEELNKSIKQTTLLKTRSWDDIFIMMNENNVKEYNIHKYITKAEYIKYQSKIKKAFEFDYTEMMNGNKSANMKVIFISGPSGSGKTSYANYILGQKNNNLVEEDIFISTDSYDPLDGYKGQPVVILDEFRANQWDLPKFLAMINNNTRTATKSRFSNKKFICHTLIITSLHSIHQFSDSFINTKDEDMFQLFRRIKTCINFNYHTIDVFAYNLNEKKYNKIKTLDNNIIDYLEKNNLIATEVEHNWCAETESINFDF